MHLPFTCLKFAWVNFFEGRPTGGCCLTLRSPGGPLVPSCWRGGGCGGACCHCFVSTREEAKEMWEKREAEWERERNARDRLMTEVITAVMDVGWLVPRPATGREFVTMYGPRQMFWEQSPLVLF